MRKTDNKHNRIKKIKYNILYEIVDTISTMSFTFNFVGVFKGICNNSTLFLYYLTLLVLTRFL